MHNYHDVNRTFPPGWIGVTNGQMDWNGPSGWCWATFILPYLEQGNIYERLSFSLPILDATNSAVYLQSPLQALFRNPNDIGPEIFTITTPSNSWAGRSHRQSAHLQLRRQLGDHGR